MNKEKAILKINKFGKIGKIITIIMLVIIAFSALGTLAAAITFKVMPKDIIQFNLNNSAEMVLNPSAIDSTITNDEMEQIANTINQSGGAAGLNMGAASYKFETAQVTDGKIVANSNANIGNVSLSKIGSALFVAVFVFILTFISVLFGCFLCNAVQKCSSPFEDNVIKKMKNFAYSLIPWALFSSVPTSVINNIFGNNLKYNFSLDLNVIFAVLVILALTTVFKYGAILQVESDETL